MGFKLLILTPTEFPVETHIIDRWPERLKQAIPDIEVTLCHSVGEAMEVIEEADAAFGNIVPELFDRAKNLKWIQGPQAGPRAGYYHQALIDSDVVVTNVREIYNDHISAHIMSFVLAFARGLHVYIPHQLQRQWRSGYETVHLPDSTAVSVGVGGIGGETARLCSEFGMKVIAVDPRRPAAPPGAAELHRPEALDQLLPRGRLRHSHGARDPRDTGDVPRRPVQADEAHRVLHQHRPRGHCGPGRSGGRPPEWRDSRRRPRRIPDRAFTPDHPLWSAQGVLITPHVAGADPYLDDRRTEIFIDNCLRFNEGRPLRNVVDKANWF